MLLNLQHFLWIESVLNGGFLATFHIFGSQFAAICVSQTKAVGSNVGGNLNSLVIAWMNHFGDINSAFHWNLVVFHLETKAIWVLVLLKLILSLLTTPMVSIMQADKHLPEWVEGCSRAVNDWTSASAAPSFVLHSAINWASTAFFSSCVMA